MILFCFIIYLEVLADVLKKESKRLTNQKLRYSQPNIGLPKNISVLVILILA